MTEILMACGFIILMIIALFYLVSFQRKQKDKLRGDVQTFLNEYRDALKAGNKQAALVAGRKYYARTRANGRLTIYDEQALSNDINAMKTI